MAEINITLSPADYKDQVLQSIKKQGKNAQLPGFRPGKIPVGMLKKMVGKQVMIEEINRMLQDSLSDYVEKESLDLIGSPLPSESKSEEFFDLALDKDLDFSFEIGLSPQFDLDLQKLPDVEVYDIEIDEEYLNKELENSRERFGKVDNPESVAKGDILFGKIAELNEKGEPVEDEEDGFSKMIVLNPTRIEDPAKLSIFEGKELEFSCPFSTDWYSEDKEKVAELMMITPEEVEEISAKELQFVLKRINRMSPADLDDVFFRAVLGPNYPEPEVSEEESSEGEAEATEASEEEKGGDKEETQEVAGIDEATFREKFSELLKRDWERELEGDLNNRMREKLLEVHEVEMPEAYLKHLYKAEQKEEPTEEQIDTAYPNYERSMKWTLIVDKIFKQEEDLKVTEEEINQGIIEMYMAYYPNMGPEEMQAILEHSKQNPDIIQQVSIRKMEQKIFTYLKEQFPLKETPMTVSDFLEKNKQEEEN